MGGKKIKTGSLRCELARIVSDRKFYICIVLYVAVIAVMLKSEVGGGKYSAQQAILMVSGVSNFNKLLVLVSAFPMAAAFCEDISNKYMEQMILRSSVQSYIISKLVMYAGVSFFTAFTGQTIYAVYAAVQNGIGTNTYIINNSSIYYDYAAGAFPFAAVLANIYLFSLVSSVYAVLGLAVSSLAGGRFVAVAAPVFVNTFMEVIVKKMPNALNLYNIQVGNDAYGMGTTGTLVMSTMAALGYMLIGAVIFAGRVKRRAANEIV